MLSPNQSQSLIFFACAIYHSKMFNIIAVHPRIRYCRSVKINIIFQMIQGFDIIQPRKGYIEKFNPWIVQNGLNPSLFQLCQPILRHGAMVICPILLHQMEFSKQFRNLFGFHQLPERGFQKFWQLQILNGLIHRPWFLK